MILITGIRGTLGSEIKKLYPASAESTFPGIEVSIAFLTGGRKGFHECEGDEEVFRRDVDEVIIKIKGLLSSHVFVVYISTEAVERIGHGAAYSRNRLLVEQFIWTQRGCAIIRPGRFDEKTAPALAAFCAEIGNDRREGIFHWPQ